MYRLELKLYAYDSIQSEILNRLKRSSKIPNHPNLHTYLLSKFPSQKPKLIKRLERKITLLGSSPSCSKGRRPFWPKSTDIVLVKDGKGRATVVLVLALKKVCFS
jgi:hypothetical protein